MAKKSLYILAFAMLILLTACAAGPNSEVHKAAADGIVAGFWLGIWHGMISPLTFLISLFEPNIHFYEVHNNGGWYNLGFVLGAGILAGGGSEARKRSSD